MDDSTKEFMRGVVQRLDNAELPDSSSSWEPYQAFVWALIAVKRAIEDQLDET